MKNNSIIGHFGQLSSQLEKSYEFKSQIYLFNIDLTVINSSDLDNINYKALSSYPFVKFDLSFSVKDSFNAQDLINEVEEILINNENIINIFDDFSVKKATIVAIG
jgi:phenylalanyl-tRNA synthetase beta subunit